MIIFVKTGMYKLGLKKISNVWFSSLFSRLELYNISISGYKRNKLLHNSFRKAIS